MYKIITIILVLFLCSLLFGQVMAAGKRPVGAWTLYHFDGSAFVSGPSTDGKPFIAIRDHLRPVVLKTLSANIEQTSLPADSGVIAGICYLQNSGGKLGGGSGFKPFARVPLQISSGGKDFVTIETDDQGYFVVVLPAGTYSVGNGPFAADITVDRGVTTLVPLRAGKRMVD
jgi:hypothetical protein